jgi:hypothetical protein
MELLWSRLICKAGAIHMPIKTAQKQPTASFDVRRGEGGISPQIFTKGRSEKFRLHFLRGFARTFSAT